MPYHELDDSEKQRLKELNEVQRYAQWAVFSFAPGELSGRREEAGRELADYLRGVERAGVTVRGIYLVSGSNPDGELLVWWHAKNFEDLQDALNGLRRDTELGRLAELTWVGNGLHRPSEFNKAHLPSFIEGKEPKEWLTIYPFVRSYDWYLLDPEKRRGILADHGRAAASFKDVQANTMPAFALGDYEWMLAFEADDLGRIVDLMHRMRYTEARRHVREEVPFFTGRRLEPEELVARLP